MVLYRWGTFKRWGEHLERIRPKGLLVARKEAAPHFPQGVGPREPGTVRAGKGRNGEAVRG